MTRGFAVPLAFAALLAIPAEAAPTRDELIAAIHDLARYSSDVLIDDQGRGRADYDMIDSAWRDYEVHWHTGQTLYGLIYAHVVTGEPAYLDAARRAGDWWISTELQPPHPFAGLVDAPHGDHLGPLINMTTVTDGTPGLFALARVTGKTEYADVATRSGDWFLDNMYIAEEGIFYNIADPITGEIWKDRSPHSQHKHLTPETILVTDVARPNSEGFLYADMYRHTGDFLYRKVFLEVAEKKIERQNDNGLWMDFEPNDGRTGKVHPRFNIWLAEAQLEAYKMTGEQKYLDSAIEVARFYANAQREDGTIYYDLSDDGSAQRGSLTGSATAFAGILWLRLKDYGVTEFEPNLARSIDWIVKSRFPVDHPDPNLAGAVLDTRTRHTAEGIRLIQRDIGTSFGVRFLAMVVQDLDGANVNEVMP